MQGGKILLLGGFISLLLALPMGFSEQAKERKPPASIVPPPGGTLMASPKITDVVHWYMGLYSAELTVAGQNFGDTQGTKKVRIDGTLVTSYIGWKNTAISFGTPFALTYWDHVYQFVIVDGTKVLSNVFSKRIPWDFDGMKPVAGPVGTEVTVNVFHLPASPGGLVLKLGSHNFDLISWTPEGTQGKIKAKVPPGVPVGEHDVYLQKGGQVASEVYKFKVSYSIKKTPAIKK
jgi:hypothetical protein